MKFSFWPFRKLSLSLPHADRGPSSSKPTTLSSKKATQCSRRRGESTPRPGARVSRQRLASRDQSKSHLKPHLSSEAEDIRVQEVKTRRAPSTRVSEVPSCQGTISRSATPQTSLKDDKGAAGASSIASTSIVFHPPPVKSESSQLQSTESAPIEGMKALLPGTDNLSLAGHEQANAEREETSPTSQVHVGSTMTDRKSHILKPITRETIYSDTTEEVQKIRLHEQHLTHIHFHTQPVHMQNIERETHTYRLRPSTEADTHTHTRATDEEINMEKEGLDAIIRKQVLQSVDRYHQRAVQGSSNSQSNVTHGTAEHSAIVTHHYHIIQPVLKQPRQPSTSNFGGIAIPREVASEKVLSPGQEAFYETTKTVSSVHENEELKDQIDHLNHKVQLLTAENEALKDSKKKFLGPSFIPFS